LGESSFCYLGFTANLGVSNQTTENKTKTQKLKIFKDFNFQDFQALIVFSTIKVISIDSFALLKNSLNKCNVVCQKSLSKWR
jgi:hypothetical protein